MRKLRANKLAAVLFILFRMLSIGLKYLDPIIKKKVKIHCIDADKTRYNIVVSMLDTDALQEVADLIQSPRRRTNMEDLRGPF